MGVVEGTYRKGRIELDGSVDWPDGCRVKILRDRESIGLQEADGPDSPETRAALLQAFDAMEPLEMSAADEAELEAAAAVVRETSVRAVRERMGLS